MTSCVEEVTLVGYLTGKLDDEGDREVAAHLTNCQSCQQTVELLVTPEYLQRYRRSSSPTAVDSPKLAELQHRLYDFVPHAGTRSDPSVGTNGHRQTRPDNSRRLGRVENSGNGSFSRYELLGEVGRGGMGVVYRARDLVLDRVVALKMILAGQLARPEDVKRFRMEAEAAAQLDHPHIVSVYETGQFEGQNYLAMSFVEGCTLAGMLRDGPLPPRDAASLVRIVADAIQHAHERGVIHRDLKPGNVLVDHRGNPRVTDFGLARRTDDDTGLTASGDLVGTPGYMAPEQITELPKETRPAIDIYSLGALLYALITGSPPFRAATNWRTLQMVLHCDPVPPRRLNTDVSRDLETICLKCLEKNPFRRYRTAEAVARDLTRFLNGESTLARPIGFLERLRRWIVRRPAVAISALTAIAAILALLVVLIFYSGQLQQANTELTLALGKSETMRLRAERGEQIARQLLYAADMKQAGEALAAGDYAQVARLLARHKPAAGAVDYRGFEWFYLKHQSSRDDVVKDLADGALYSVRESHDGAWIAVAGESGTVRLFDAESLRPRTSLMAEQGEVNGLAWSPDDSRLLTAGDDGTLCVWSVSEGKRLLKIDAHPDAWVFQSDFSPDGTLLASCGTDDRVALWDAQTGEMLAEFHDHTGTTEAVVFSPDSRQLASCGRDRFVRLWDVQELKLVDELNLKEGVNCIAFSPDGKWLVAGCVGGEVWIIDLETSDALFTTTYRDEIRAVAMNARGTVAVGDARGSIHGWFYDGESWNPDPDTGWQAHADRLYDLRFLQTSQHLISVGSDGRLKKWQFPRAQARREGLLEVDKFGVLAEQRRSLGVRRIAAVPGREQLVVTHVESISLWDSKSGRCEGHLTPLDDSEALRKWYTATASPDGKLVAAGGNDGVVVVWDLPNRQRLAAWTVDQPVDGIAFDPASELLAIDGSDQILVFEARSGAERSRIDVPKAGSTFRTDWSSQGLLAINSVTSQITLVDTTTNDMSHLDIPTGSTTVRFSQDGSYLAAAANSRVIHVWNVADKKVLARFVGHEGTVRDIAFGPLGRSLVSVGEDGRIIAWQLDPPARLLDLAHEDTPFCSVTFTDDGRRLVAAFDSHWVKRTMLILDISNQKFQPTFDGLR